MLELFISVVSNFMLYNGLIFYLRCRYLLISYGLFICHPILNLRLNQNLSLFSWRLEIVVIEIVEIKFCHFMNFFAGLRSECLTKLGLQYL